MATDRTEVLKNAEKLLRTGKLELAIAEYVRLIEEQPRDWQSRDTLGDLYVRANQIDYAVEQYTHVAENFLAQEAPAFAAALYRKILKIKPDEAAAQRQLAAITGQPVDADQQLARAEVELRAGRIDDARRFLAGLPRGDAALRGRLVTIAWALASSSPEGAYMCIEAAVDGELAARNHVDAAALLQEYATRVPGQIGALLKLVEVCVDGGLEAQMYETQAQLADVYLERGQGSEARAIAEDLVAREPWDSGHIDRFRRALILLHVPQPDAIIAERLSGQGPFVATDRFATSDAPVREPEPPAQPTPVPERDPLPPTAPVREPVPGPPQRDPEPDIPLRRRAEVPAAPAASLDIDLTDMLAQLQGSSASLAPTIEPEEEEEAEEDLDAPRTDASRQAGVQEAREQVDLARTYLDMGMADEAMAALGRAAKVPAVRFEAASILGRLYLKKQDFASAVEWLERAAEAPAPSEDEGRELLYDLGTTLEQTGEVSRALAVFMELQADAGDYRDVAARVDRLARVQTGG